MGGQWGSESAGLGKGVTTGMRAAALSGLGSGLSETIGVSDSEAPSGCSLAMNCSDDSAESDNLYLSYSSQIANRWSMVPCPVGGSVHEAIELVGWTSLSLDGSSGAATATGFSTCAGPFSCPDGVSVDESP